MLKGIIHKHLPKFYQRLVDVSFLVKNKTLHPEKIDLENGLHLFANWHEPRGKSLIMGKAKGQPNIKQFWNKGIQLFRPDVALDVGANYGEVMFGTRYGSWTRLILGVEANPTLMKYLNKSLEAHPDKQRIELIDKLASDSQHQQVEFYIDETSSGRSTALKNNFVKKSNTVLISSFRLDDFILSKLIPSTIVYKIDVEGFEPFVLNGMKRLFESKCNMIGCIEFNLESLINNNIDAESYILELSENNIICILHRDGNIERLKYNTLNEIKTKFPEGKVETDLILFNNDQLYNEYNIK